jgi:hypothetical protein
MIKNFEDPVDHESLLITELINEVEEFYQSFVQRGCPYPDRNIFTEIDDDKFEELDRFQASIQLQFQRSFPPTHNIVIKSAKNHCIKNVLFSYEYSYRYVADSIFTKSVAINKILFILRTVHWINRCRIEYQILAEKRFAKLRFSEQLTYWDDLFLISEIQNKKYTEVLEKWIDKTLTPDQKNEQSLAYERYWDGIPEQKRHFIISNL